MNNLLRTLTESQVKPVADLRLLLTTVKEGRKQGQDAKLADPFYDSLEGLLVDLKTITIDNRDAEAFLKPVSKSEVLDYYDVISNPMDFQTMLKKVKQKQYKSKRDFKDDLDLIWSNCYTYNASENHPLRQCVNRLKVKAERLLKNITDRKERQDPPIPSDLPTHTGIARPRMNGINGYTNGHSSHTRSPSITIMPKPATPTSSYTKSNVKARRNMSFADSLAIVRTPEGMAKFGELDREVGSFQPKSTLAHTLREMAPNVEYESESEDETAMVVDSIAGEKRKPNGTSDHRPRKRARFAAQYPTPLLDEKDDLSQLWWGAVQSDALLANGLPGIPFGPSSSVSHRRKSKGTKQKRQQEVQPPQNPKSILSMMNNNIKTMRRVRHTHAKFAALNATTAPPEDEEGAESGLYGAPSGPSGSRPPGTSTLPSLGSGLFAIGDDDAVDEKINEAPWTPGRGQGPVTLSGVEIGEENADDCLHWATEKMLEHAGFQGTSKVAMDVLADVTAEYLLNVGRTIRFLSDKFGKTMTPEEIILHTLFESGSSKVQDLERYVSDDIERYGARLGELEKKLVGAYRETTAGEILEDEGLFEEESDGETGALAIGEFADLLGEDYLGLRELGIASEFGLSGLSIPKKLLRSKKGQNKPTAAKPTEPPPPFPPPPPFIPLSAAMVDTQIGLLKPYYQNRFSTLAATTQPVSFTAPSLTGPSLLHLPGPSMPPPPGRQLPTTNLPPTAPPGPPVPQPDLLLPDDSPNPSQLKISPIGQIVKSGTSSGAAKKKAAAAKAATDVRAITPATMSQGGAGGTTPSATTPGASPKKKKGNMGIGSGNGRKKKQDGPGSTPTPGFGGQGGHTLPAVVIASA